MSTLSVKHLLGIKNLQCEDIELIFRTADNSTNTKGAISKRYHYC